MDENKLESSVGISRNWDARTAGKEVAKMTIKGLKSVPNFFVLFSTIHYKKKGGFKELLNGVYDVLPKNVPLIGGTVTGFMNNYGVFSRGVTALAVSYDKLDVVVAHGKNTKRNPKKAAINCSKLIKKGLEKSDYKNKFLLNLISASEVPNIPPLGRKKIIREGMAIKIIMQLFGFSQYVLQKGAGRDDEVLEEMIKHLPDYYMIGGGTVDDGAGFTNYQFINDQVLTNSIVSLGLSTDYKLDVMTTHNMKKTDISFEITKTSKDGRFIHEINGKPAADEFLKLLNWNKDNLTEETWFKTNFYFPLGVKLDKEKNNYGPRVIAGIFGNSLITTIRSKESKGTILTIDGKGLLDTIDNNLINFPSNPEFGLISSCVTRLNTLGDKIFLSYDHILDYFNNKPFIVFYVGGESTYSPGSKLNYVNMSFNTAIFWKEKNNLYST